MKLNVELDDSLASDEIVIRCKAVTLPVKKIIDALHTPQLVLYKNNQELYMPSDEVLFFETDSDTVYAHGAEDCYKTKYRLYELEKMLPDRFVRVSKSAILNANKIASVDRSLYSPSLVKFRGSSKQLYVSRHYYKDLKQALNRRV